MPWTVADVDQHKKGLTKDQKKGWASVANGILKNCLDNGGKDSECAQKAIRVANSKYSNDIPLNRLPFSDDKINDIKRTDLKLKELWSNPGECPKSVKDIYKLMFFKARMKNESYERSSWIAWKEVHREGWYKNKEGKWMKRKSSALPKNFQFQTSTPPDPRDNHTHNAAFDEDGNGGTSEAGDPIHVHAVFGFKIQPYYSFDPETNSEYVSVHPGSIAFKKSKFDEDDYSMEGMTDEQKTAVKKCVDKGGSRSDCMDMVMKKMSELGSFEMEIFRAGTHNGDEFTEGDLAEIASNFKTLKNEIRPKLKITHHGEDEEQMQLAGLASYGDIVDVYLKKVDSGPQRLFAKVANVPKEVLSWIKDRRFPERSVEIYPEFKLGTRDDSPVYKNVLKAVALLGHEMPAVTGMAPISLEECLECQGTECLIFSMPDTEIVDEKRGSKVPSHEEIEGDEGTVTCPSCQFDIPVEKLENAGTGFNQCPQCGRMILPEDLEGTPAEKDLEETSLRFNIFKEKLNINIKGGD